MIKQQTPVLQEKNLLLEKIRQNYQSIIMGLFVVLTTSSIFLAVIVKQPKREKTIPRKNQQKISASKTNTVFINKYVIKEGDDLWKIAEKFYGSGFNAYDLMKANGMNSNQVEIGQTLVIPSVKPKEPTVGITSQIQTEKVTFTGKKYVVKEGDDLWQIALKTYGDGYQWTKIAKANSLSSPNDIHVGNILIIPR